MQKSLFNRFTRHFHQDIFDINERPEHAIDDVLAQFSQDELEELSKEIRFLLDNGRFKGAWNKAESDYFLINQKSSIEFALFICERIENILLKIK